jgi:hypothetical protein
MISSFVNTAFAVNLEVEFNPNPLFTKPNFLPEDETSGKITVINNSGITQDISTEAINVVDDDNFGDLLHLTIIGESGVVYDDSLSDFLTTIGEYSLGEIGNGETKVFTYIVSFNNSDDNSYQGKSLGFDICVGFKGESLNCGDTIIGGENGEGEETIIEGSGGGGSGGISESSSKLIITDEQSENISEVNSLGLATITWNTNKLSTSQVIYGVAPGPYNLDLDNLPNLGYPLGSVEDSTKVKNHSVLLTGLTPGATYLYRVVSHASPATVSREYKFTIPLLSQVDNGLVLGDFTENKISNNNLSREEVILKNNTENISDEYTEEDNKSNYNNLIANALGSGFKDNYILILIIAIVLAIFFSIYRKKTNKNK